MEQALSNQIVGPNRFEKLARADGTGPPIALLCDWSGFL